MGHFLIYQLLPLALLWTAFAVLARVPAFRFWGVPLVFLAGAAMQFALWRQSRPNLDNPDSLGFFRLAHGLETDLRAILFRPKLYPCFLAPFHALKAATGWQCTLKLGMGGLLLRFAAICGWKPVTRAYVLFLFLFGSLWLSAPLAIFDTALFAFLFAAFLVLAADVLSRYSAPKFAAMCLAAGLTTLTRQAADLSIALVVGMTVLVLAYRAAVGSLAARPQGKAPAAQGVIRVLRSLGIPILAGLLLAETGACYNGIRHGAYRRSVALGVNLYTHAAYYGLSDPRSREWDFVEGYLPDARRECPPWQTGFTHDMPWSVNALPHRLERKLGSADAAEILASDRILRGRSLDWAMRYPESYLASFANEISRLTRKCEDIFPASLLDPESRAPAVLRRLELGIIHPALWLLLTAGSMHLLVWRRNRLVLLVPALGAVFYLALVAAVQIGLTRYALPAILPLLMLFGEAADRLPAFPTALTREGGGHGS